MAESYLDIGTLTGAVELDDRFSGALEKVYENVTHFATHILGSFTGLATGVLGVATVLTGIASTITGLAVKGSEVNDVTEGFERLAGSARKAEGILEAMRDGTVGVIDNMKLMRDANRLLGAGVNANVEDFRTLTTAARTLSNQGYGDLNTVLNRLNTAMIQGSAYRLKSLGITIDGAKAERQYADSIGTTANFLDRAAKQDANRVAILAALTEKVDAGGVAQKNFAEKFESTLKNIKNWVYELERLIAKSPTVVKAFDTIAEAIKNTFGEEAGPRLMKNLVAAAERFSQWVIDNGPEIVAIFGKIWEIIKVVASEVVNFYQTIKPALDAVKILFEGVGRAIGSMFDTVKGGWDLLPDWLKNFIKFAVEAKLVLWGAQKALQGLFGTKPGGGEGGGEGGFMGMIQKAMSCMCKSPGSGIPNIPGIPGLGGKPDYSGPRPVPIPPLPGELPPGSGGPIGRGLDQIITKGRAAGAAFQAARVGLGAFLEPLLGAEVATMGLGAAFGTVGAALGVGIPVVYGSVKAYEIYKVAAENARLTEERRQEDLRQAPVDIDNLTRLNKVMGTSYTDLDKAVEASRDWLKEHAEELKKNREESEADRVEQKKWTDQIDAQVESLDGLAKEVDTTAQVFEKLSMRTKLDREVQTKLIADMDAQREKHIKLTEAQSDYYDMVTKSRLADRDYAAQKLLTGNAIQKQAANLRELGFTEDEIAKKLGVSTKALKENEKGLLERIAAMQRAGMTEKEINKELGVTNDEKQRAIELLNRERVAQDAMTEALNAYNVALTHGGVAETQKQRDDAHDKEMRNYRESKDYTEKGEKDKQEAYEQTEKIRKMQEDEAAGSRRALAIKDRDEAKHMLDVKLRDSSQFSAAEIQEAQQLYNDKARAAEHWQSIATESEKQAAEAAKKASEERVAALEKEKQAQEEWQKSWSNIQISMDRAQAEQTAKRGITGNMWQDFYVKIAEASLKLLDEADLKSAMAQYKTREELQKTADFALKVFNAMRSAGTYTAEALEQAWKRYTDALNEAKGLNSDVAKQEAQAAARRKQQAESNIQRMGRNRPMLGEYSPFRPRPDQNELRWGSSPDATAGRIGGPVYRAPITFTAGSIVVQYPIMNDPRAKNEIARMLGDAFVGNIRSKGKRV